MKQKSAKRSSLKLTAIQATLLLTSVIVLNACQKQDGKKASRVRVNSQQRMSLKTQAQKDAEAAADGRTEEGDNNDQILPTELCLKDGKALKDCAALRAVVVNGTLTYGAKKETASAGSALKLAISAATDSDASKSKKSVSVAKTTEGEKTVFTITNKNQNEGKKLVIVMASSSENAKLKEVDEAIDLPNTRKKTLILSKDNKDIKGALSDIQSDELVLLVTMKGDANTVSRLKTALTQAKIENERIITQEVTPANFGYQVEGKALQLIGTRIYLHFQLPESYEKIDLSSIEVTVNDKTVGKLDEDYVIEKVTNSAEIRIITLEFVTKINDVLKIKYNLKKSATE